jgi:hypothetical protein
MFRGYFLPKRTAIVPSHSMPQNDNCDQHISIKPIKLKEIITYNLEKEDINIYYYASDAALYFLGLPPMPPMPKSETPLPSPNRRSISAHLNLPSPFLLFLPFNEDWPIFPERLLRFPRKFFGSVTIAKTHLSSFYTRKTTKFRTC